MPHLMFELLLWIILAFFVGCILGCVFRRLFGPEPELVVAAAAGKPAKATKSDAAPAVTRSTLEPAPVPTAAKTEAPTEARAAPTAAKAAPTAAKAAPTKAKAAPTAAKAAPTAAKAAPTEAKAAPPAAVSDSTPQQPKGIAAPRGGKPDNLRRVSGIGPKIERTLQGLGIFHFDQIASWTPEEVQWVDEHLNFKGRIARDEWQSQARLLAGGKADEATESEADKKPGQRKPPARKRVKK